MFDQPRVAGVLMLLVLATAATPVQAQQAVAVAASPTTAEIQTPASGHVPPLPNRLNDVLPSWLRLRGEYRIRAERADNVGFRDDVDDSFAVSRVRVNATASARRLSATVQLQDARVVGKDVGSTGPPYKATLDLRQLYAEVNAGIGGLVVRLGRQELAFGNQQLVAGGNWTNAGRTFDGARVTLAGKALHVDLFGASLVRILNGESDKSGAGNRLAGAYLGTDRVVPHGTFEPYLFWRRDVNRVSEVRTIGTLSQFTPGARLLGSLPWGVDYNVEMVAQRGSLGTDNVRAWAGHWQIRKTAAGRLATHAGAEYNYASGDANPADGSRGTFDPMYPTSHDRFGLADQVGWKNIHNLRVGFDVAPLKATPVTFNYHNYWLAERRDALYSASGAALARVPAGARSRRVGQEIDLQMTHPLSPQLALAVAYSHLFPGAFLAEATPGRSYRNLFAMLTYVFLAEK